MSYDLLVFAPSEPNADALPAQTARVEVERPERVELDDVPEVALAAMLAPTWQVAFLARHTKAAIAEARRMARALAEACAGLVYDPQDDVVVWPRRGRRDLLPRTGAEERRIEVLEVTWCVARRLSSADCGAFLDAVARVLPEAGPTRWGTYEPLQGRGEGFCAEWDGDDNVFWSGRRPVFDGSIWLHQYETRWGDKRPPRLVDSIHLTLDASATVLHTEAWQRGIEIALAEISRSLGAFFGAAHLERDWILGRGRLWADGTTEGNTHTVAAKSWLGLPNFPCRLMWLGPEYRVLMEGARWTDGARLEPMGDGALLRCSEAPAERPGPTEIGIDPRLVRPGHQFDAPAAEFLPEIVWPD